MRDPKRIKPLLKQIEKIWSRAPDIRFGQLLVILFDSEISKNTFNIEDDKIIKLLEANKDLWKKVPKSKLL